MATNDNDKNTKKPAEISDAVRRLARVIVWGGTALIIFIVFFVNFWRSERKSVATEPAGIVIMGDSIFANTYDETSVASMLAEKIGTQITDVSFGGSCMSYIDKDARLDYSTDAFCMAALTQAMLAEDFRYQENANINLNATEYFEARIEVLKHIDFSGTDILIINHLLNDYQIAVPVKSESNPYDEYTFEGAYRSVISSIKKKYPNLRIILVTPVKTWYGEDRIPSTEMDIGGGTIDVYLDCQKAIAEEFDNEWISMMDLYDNAVAENPELLKDEDGNDIEMWAAFTQDIVHPNKAAREMIAECIYEYIANGD